MKTAKFTSFCLLILFLSPLLSFSESNGGCNSMVEFTIKGIKYYNKSSIDIKDGDSVKICIILYGPCQLTSPASVIWIRNGDTITNQTSPCLTTTQAGSYKAIYSAKGDFTRVLT